MTTITIERKLLERALDLIESEYLHLPEDKTYSLMTDIRAALAAPEQCWCDEQGIGEPGVSCGDCPIRDYKGAATAPQKLDPTGSELPSEQADQQELPSQGQVLATAPDRHAQELLAQDITLQNMAERHAQELCAYQITVDKLRACGNEAEHGIGEQS